MLITVEDILSILLNFGRYAEEVKKHAESTKNSDESHIIDDPNIIDGEFTEIPTP